MNDNKIVKIAAVGFLGLVVFPKVWDTTISLAELAGAGARNFVNKKKYNRELKKGLKDGSIMEIDYSGKYYKVNWHW